MNEKLKEKAKKLMTQAWEFVDHDLETVERDHVVTYSEHLEMVHTKFAELFVRECYEHCKGQMLDKEVADTNELTYNDAVMDCSNGLLEHFGVEL